MGEGEAENLCKRVRAAGERYWMTEPDIRCALYNWLHDHVNACDPCALYLEKIAERWQTSED